MWIEGHHRSRDTGLARVLPLGLQEDPGPGPCFQALCLWGREPLLCCAVRDPFAGPGCTPLTLRQDEG